jgi:hypothetical protein
MRKTPSIDPLDQPEESQDQQRAREREHTVGERFKSRLVQ